MNNSSNSPRIFCTYVDCGMPQNFDLARHNGIWGAKEFKKFQPIRENDYLVFINCIKSNSKSRPRGFPRVNISTFVSAEIYAEMFLLVKVITEVFEKDEKLWEDNLYPWRFGFEEIRQLNHVDITHLSLSGVLNQDEVDVIRTSMYDTDVTQIRQFPSDPNDLINRLWSAYPFPEINYPDEIPNNEVFPETRKNVSVNAFERNQKARERCIAYHGNRCSVCEFDFAEFYGPIGEGYIHVHHLKPLSEIDETYMVNPISDLRPVCPNCHAMLHKRTPPFTINELKDILASLQKHD